MDNNINNQNNVKNDLNAKLKSYWNNPIIVTIMVLAIIIVPKVLINKYNKEAFFFQINKVEKEYVIPFIKERYGSDKYDLKYKKSGECYSSGNCDFDPTFGIDGGLCSTYKVLNDKECKAHYFTLKIDDKTYPISYINNHGNKYVVEGKTIYGGNRNEYEYLEDKLYNNCILPFMKENYDIPNSVEYGVTISCPNGDREECNVYNYSLHNGIESIKVKAIYESDKVTVVYIDGNITKTYLTSNLKDDYSAKIDHDRYRNREIKKDNSVKADKFPFNSDYYPFDNEHTISPIILDESRGIELEFYPGILFDKSEIYIYSEVINNNYLSGNVSLIFNFYDKNHEQIGMCEESIEFKDHRNTNSGWAHETCSVIPRELKTNNFDDVAYFNVNVVALDIWNDEKNRIKSAVDYIDKYPFESKEYLFTTTNRTYEIYLDDDVLFNFQVETDPVFYKEDIEARGSVYNPRLKVGNIDFTIIYYDKDHNEIGRCNKLGKIGGYRPSESNVMLCPIKRNALSNNKTVDDIYYFKYIISSYNAK